MDIFLTFKCCKLFSLKVSTFSRAMQKADMACNGILEFQITMTENMERNTTEECKSIEFYVLLRADLEMMRGA